MPVEEAQWFAMRDLTRPNAKMPAFRMLSERGFEVFTPMVTKLSVSPAGKKLRLHVPAIHDLLLSTPLPRLSIHLSNTPLPFNIAMQKASATASR